MTKTALACAVAVVTLVGGSCATGAAPVLPPAGGEPPARVGEEREPVANVGEEAGVRMEVRQEATHPRALSRPLMALFVIIDNHSAADQAQAGLVVSGSTRLVPVCAAAGLLNYAAMPGLEVP